MPLHGSVMELMTVETSQMKEIAQVFYRPLRYTYFLTPKSTCSIHGKSEMIFFTDSKWNKNKNN